MKSIGKISLIVFVVSLMACIGLSLSRAQALVKITVTADPDLDEPKDHELPFVKQKEALPDYEIVVLKGSSKTSLGTKPNTLAKDGLSWIPPEPIPLFDITSVRLQEHDQLLSDVIAEVQYSNNPVIESGYTFQFKTEFSLSAGLSAFFYTPIGMALLAAVFLAVFIPLIMEFA